MIQGRDTRAGWVVLLCAAVAGCCVALFVASRAGAASTTTWTTYDISSLAGGAQSDRRPDVITDPLTGQLAAIVNSPSSGNVEFSGDGASGAVTWASITGQAGGGETPSGWPVAITDPQTGHFLVFTDTSNGDLIDYDRAPGGAWTIANLSAGCCGEQLPTIASNPSAVVLSSTDTLEAAGESSGGDLIADSRTTNGVWSAVDVTSATGQGISSDPFLLSDPNGGYPDVFAEGTNGDLINFYNTTGTWQDVDLTSTWGGQTIAGDPVPITVDGTVYVFAPGPGGDLIEWTRAASNSAWSSQNLTTISGGPTVDGTPSVVVDPNGGIDVFLAGTDSDLIEYSGSGSSWTATDLTASDGGPTADSSPGAAINPAGNLVVWVTGPSNTLYEMERTVSSSSASGGGTGTGTQTGTGTPTGTGTQTGTGTATPTTGSGTTKATLAKLNVLIYAQPYSVGTATRLLDIAHTPLPKGARITLTDRGPHHPKLRLRTATGTRIAALTVALSRIDFPSGDTLTITITAPKRRTERLQVSFRAHKKPIEKRLS